MVIIQNITVTALLAYSSYIDIKERRVSNKICLCVAVLALFNFSVWNLLGLITAFVVLVIALYGRGSSADGIGGGDVKLIAAVSLCLGLEGTMIMLFCAASAMLIFYRITKLIKGEKADKMLPFVPFITLGTLITFILI